MSEKRCNKCGEVKPLEEFHKNKRLKDGHANYCKVCRRQIEGERLASLPPDYSAWKAMVSRCHNPNNDQYPRYGGRGISVCARWRSSFDSFILDMGPRPTRKHQIDRIDNDKGYFRSNCHWVTCAANNRNRSTTILDMSLARSIRWHHAFAGYGTRELAEMFGVKNSTISGVLSGEKWKEGAI